MACLKRRIQKALRNCRLFYKTKEHILKEDF
jgi:hypothetical protein